MKHWLIGVVWIGCRAMAVLVCVALAPAINPAYAQGVTTASMTGLVRDAQGAVIPGAAVTAIHEPSGTRYESITQGDGRFFIPGMRVGGPYRVSASVSGFSTEVKENVSLSLGVAQDLDFTLKVAAIAEDIVVVGVSDPVFSSNRTGAATAVTRDELATLPTISGRIGDMTRLTPQASGSNFAGQDNRLARRPTVYDFGQRSRAGVPQRRNYRDPHQQPRATP